MKLKVKDVAGRSSVLAGRAGLQREITVPQLVTPALDERATWRDAQSACAHLSPSQIARLCTEPSKVRSRLLKAFLRVGPSAVILSGGAVCPELLAAAEAAAVPVLKSRNVPKLARTLSERLAQRMNVHGVLVDIFGLGTLIIGESAIGKSEAALDLVLRGHKLAADDIVLLAKTGGVVAGGPTELGRDLLEIRGLGVVNVRALYGESATVASSTVGLVVELQEWREGEYYSLLGLRERRYRILGVKLPYLKLPVKPGRNMATLIEVAARNQMLKDRGLYTARELNRKLHQRLAR